MGKKGLKIYEVPLTRKIDYTLHNYDTNISLKRNLENLKFYCIDEFTNLIVRFNKSEINTDQEFLFKVNLKPSLVNELKKYLIKHKNFVLNYIYHRNESFEATHLYQLYLEYIPYKLTEIEKSIFLDGYIKMLTDLKGNKISSEKRLKLEKKLDLNVD